MTNLLSRARIYIGPDTSVTHLATAAGCQTIALFGTVVAPMARELAAAELSSAETMG